MITQQGVAGSAGVSRQDLVLGQQVTLTNSNDSGVRSWRWVMKDRPTGSAASIASPLSATAAFTPDVAGSYLVELTIDEGREGQVDTRIAAVRETVHGQLIRWPAAGEDNEANWEIGGSPNTRGWLPALESALRAALAGGFGAVNVMQFGAAGDGVANDTSAFTAALQSLRDQGGGSLRVPKGTYRVQLSSAELGSVPIAIVGDGPESTILDFTGTTSDVLDLRSSLLLRDLCCAGWSALGGDRKLLNITEAASQIPAIVLDNCTFRDAPDGWVLFSAQQNSGATDAAGVARLSIRGCEFDTVAWGIQVETYNLQDATVVASRFQDIEENAVWLGRDIATPLSAFEGQGDYLVANCQFHRIGDGSVQSDPDRHAVICFGKRAVVHGNTIDTVDNDTHVDCEGIYIKCTEAVISNNTLYNAGRGQGFIAQKGNPRAAGTRPGYNVLVTNNILRASPGWADATAISIGVGEIIVTNNVIDGMTDTPIVVGGSDGDILDVEISRNRIVNTVAAVALSLNCPGSRSIKVRDNVIDGIDGDTGNAVGVVVSNGDTEAYEEVVIAGNTFRNFTGGGAHVCGVLDNMTQNPSVNLFDIARNRFDAMPHGLKFAAASPRHLRLRIFENDFTGCATAGVDGHANLLTQRTRLRANAGFRSENSGVAAFSGGVTSVVVTHGLSWTRRLDRRIVLVPGVSAPGTVPYITATGTTTFTVNVDGGHSDQIGWQVLPHEEPFS